MVGRTANLHGLCLMNTGAFDGIPSLHDQHATLWLLTGPSWAWFIQQALRHAERSILISVYLLSPHWQRPRPGTTNLLAELCGAGSRLEAQGKLCRAVLGNPAQNKYTARYNQEAAAHLVTTGWSVRLMQTAQTLHEKIMIVDDEICVIGSHNISKSSATANLDTSIGIHSKTVAGALKASWWSRWNTATAWTGTGDSDGASHQSKHPDRPASGIQRPGKPARLRIL